MNKFKDRKLIALLSLFSVAVHVLALLFMHHMEIGFYSPQSNSIEKEDGLLDKAVYQEGTNRSKQLEETFKTFNNQKTVQADKEFSLEGLENLPIIAEDFNIPSNKIEIETLIEKDLNFSVASIPTETLVNDLNLLNLAESNEHSITSVDISKQMIEQLIESTDRVISTLQTHSQKELNQSTTDLLSAPEMAQSHGLHYDLDTFGKIVSTQDFTTKVRYTLNPDGNSYLFEIQLIPKKGVAFRRIRKNILFIIDRSNSIEKDRYETSKEAIKSVLSSIPIEDSFNILVFDSKVDRFNETPLHPDPDTIERAVKFLDQQEFGGLFSSTDIYQSLEKTIPKVVNKQEINVAILLSDGGSSFNREQKRKALSSWISDNQRKVSLFCVSSGIKNNHTHLNLLSTYNKGLHRHCNNHEDLESLLEDLLNEIKDPIGKDLVATAISLNESLDITLYPRKERLPDLYDNKPYLLYGKINKLESFHLFIQGKYYDRWLDVKHAITFDEVGTIPFTYLKLPLTLHQSYDHYDSYLKDGRERDLTQAKELLKSINTSSAF